MQLGGRISNRWKTAFRKFKGVKAAMPQDEYTHTNLIKQNLEELGINLVFTCVPPQYQRAVYGSLVDRARFVRVLTGYVPESLEREDPPRLVDRPIVIGYRGRELAPTFGRLCRLKYTAARKVKERAQSRFIPCDIETSSDARLHGEAWANLLRRCRAVIGTESGSNVFDWDDKLRKRLGSSDSKWTDDTLWESEYNSHVKHLEGATAIMNQVSPRVFEAAALGTAMVLVEGEYSGVVKPHEHYIPLKADLTNVDDCLSQLNDVESLQAMADRARRDVVDSGKWSYRRFTELFDSAVEG